MTHMFTLLCELEGEVGLAVWVMVIFARATQKGFFR